MSNNEHPENEKSRNWITKIGEASGYNDKRLELLNDRSNFEAMLEANDQNLASAFPTIADAEMRPKILRAIDVIDLLTDDQKPDAETAEMLDKELYDLSIALMREKRAQAIQRHAIEVAGVYGNAPIASEDHFYVDSPGWQNKPQ